MNNLVEITTKSDAHLTVRNVHSVSDARVFVEQNDATHNRANLFQRVHPLMRFERRKVLKVFLSHDGVQRVANFCSNLKEFYEL